MANNRSVHFNATLLLVTRVVTLMAAFCFDAVFSRALGSEMRGMYAIVISGSVLASGMGNLSLFSSLIWVGATRRITGPRLCGVTYLCIALGSLLSLIMLEGFFLCAPGLTARYVFNQSESGLVRALILFMIPVAVAESFAQRMLNGINSVDAMSLAQSAYAISRVLMTVGLFLVLDAGMEGVVVLIVATGLVQLFGGFYLPWRACGGLSFKRTLGELRTLIGFGIQRHLGSIAVVVNTQVSLFIVNAHLDLENVGVFAVALRLAETTGLLSSILFQATLHRIGSAPVGEARELTEKSCRISMLLMVLVVVVSTPAVWILVPVIWGQAFADVGLLFGVLLLGYFWQGLSPIAIYATYTIGRPMVGSWCTFAGTLVGLPAQLWLTQEYGALGAALGVSTTLAVVALVLALWYRAQARCRFSRLLVPCRLDAIMLWDALTSLVKRLRS